MTDSLPPVRLAVRGLCKEYVTPDGIRPVLSQLSFEVRAAEFVSVVGPSGTGKSTLLRCLSGLLAPTSGELLLDGEPVTGPPDKLALVLQDYSRSLMPWLTIEANIALPLRRLRLDKAERAERIASSLAAVGLSGCARMHPWQLSGGMQQRASIARALAYRPEVLVMDEPFASLDAQTRADLEDLVLRLRDDTSITVILVTHDIDEAVYLSDRVVALTGTPATITDLIAIDLPRPRDQITSKALAEFRDARSTILRHIRRGVAGPAETAAISA